MRPADRNRLLRNSMDDAASDESPDGFPIESELEKDLLCVLTKLRRCRSTSVPRPAPTSAGAAMAVRPPSMGRTPPACRMIGSAATSSNSGPGPTTRRGNSKMAAHSSRGRLATSASRMAMRSPRWLMRPRKSLKRSSASRSSRAESRCDIGPVASRFEAEEEEPAAVACPVAGQHRVVEGAAQPGLGGFAVGVRGQIRADDIGTHAPATSVRLGRYRCVHGPTTRW